MTTEEFNLLPLPAREYIEKQQGCVSCGKSQDIDTLYKNYLLMSKKALFTLRMGAVSYKTEAGEGGVLYPIHPSDSDETIKAKLKTALEVHAIAPGKFSDIQEEKIAKILAVDPDADVDPDEKPAKKLYGAAKAAADKKAAAEVDDLE